MKQHVLFVALGLFCVTAWGCGSSDTAEPKSEPGKNAGGSSQGGGSSSVGGTANQGGQSNTPRGGAGSAGKAGASGIESGGASGIVSGGAGGLASTGGSAGTAASSGTGGVDGQLEGCPDLEGTFTVSKLEGKCGTANAETPLEVSSAPIFCGFRFTSNGSKGTALSGQIVVDKNGNFKDQSLNLGNCDMKSSPNCVSWDTRTCSGTWNAGAMTIMCTSDKGTCNLVIEMDD